ncbi:hypothetical protein [Arthrobacter sp. ISL-65]|uniref:hypothetical protein n=1 Tax=Arthrobacter sp. ISL-65 TaxID=2819112 RepID=UPI001BE8CF41|nr:hypothetical protein [Arthrobacter sp. ISL-65]MBT2548052.1 hypothetical protein [Arthrobacter sp. ISL-65]
MVFGTVYTSEVLLNTALGLYKPSTWSGQDWTVDIINKYVQATATGVFYDHVFAPAHGSYPSPISAVAGRPFGDF